MSKLSNDIFKNADHYITSPFGRRGSFSTSAGVTAPFHSGVDYGTNGKKLPQYAIDEGYIISCGADSAAYGGALYVWVAYPSRGIKLLHYHLDSIAVKSGQKVKKGTKLGCTGMSGRATGIHLHLGLKKLSGGDYIDPETWSKEVYEKRAASKPSASKPTTTAKSFLPSRGYFKKGDVSANVGKIASFMRKNFPAYTDKKALGNTYGPYLIAAVKEFQKRTGLTPDGCFGPKTLAMLKKYGFEE